MPAEMEVATYRLIVEDEKGSWKRNSAVTRAKERPGFPIRNYKLGSRNPVGEEKRPSWQNIGMRRESSKTETILGKGHNDLLRFFRTFLVS